MLKAELRWVVETWKPIQGFPMEKWARGYQVIQVQWRKTVVLPSAPCKCQTMNPSPHVPDQAVESVHYDLDHGIYVVELERYREVAPHTDEVAQDLRDDLWEPYPWDGDFGE